MDHVISCGAGVTLAIDTCYEVWDSGIISVPWDFDISELRPQLIKLLGPGSTTTAASSNPSKPEAAVDGTGFWSRSATRTHCTGRHRQSRLLIGGVSQQDQLVKACMSSRSQAPVTCYLRKLYKQALPPASCMPASDPSARLAGRRLACSHRTHSFRQPPIKF